MQVDIYASRRRSEMFWYLPEGAAPEALEDKLQQLLGPMRLALQLELHPDRKLLRADVQTVMQEIQEKGYYLQLPPPTEPPAQSR